MTFGFEMEDVLAVLEFANVELLERRYLDRQLDTALDQAYEALRGERGNDSSGLGYLKLTSGALPNFKWIALFFSNA